MSEYFSIDGINADIFLCALAAEYAKAPQQKARSKIKETHF
jgi:hypothetical protein